MLIFISLFAHHGNQEWGVDEGTQGNTFFPLLAGEEAGVAQPGMFCEMAGDYSRLRAQWSSVPKSNGEGCPHRSVTLWDTQPPSVQSRPSEPRQEDGTGSEAGQGPSPPVKDSGILHSPASHALPLSLPEEADPRSLPSPDSSPPVSICPPSLAPVGYITILFPMPASVTWPHPALGSSWSPPPLLSDHTVHAPPHPLPARREQWSGELYLALANSFTFPDLAF